MCGQVWWPILWICALHLAHSSAHRHTHTVNTHPEQWAANAAAPGSNWVTHLKWTVSKWKSVLWSDESKCDILVGNHRHLVLRAKKEGDLSACYQRSVQKPPSLMVWGCITALRCGQLACFGRYYECWKVHKGFRATYAPLQMTCISAGQCKTTYCSYYNSILQLLQQTTAMLFWLDFHQTQSNLYKWFRMQRLDWSSTSPKEHMLHLSLSPCTGYQLQLVSSSRHWCLHIKQPQGQHPSRSLRSASERRLVVPSQRGSKSLSRKFSFTVPGWWNDLPTPIRTAGSLSTFKQQLKTHLFQHYLTSS